MTPITLYFCIFTVMIGNGATLTVLPFSIERMALGLGASSAEASFQVGMITGIFAPLWGRFSDRWGRRPPFLIGLSGYALAMLLFGLGTNLVMLYAGLHWAPSYLKPIFI